MRRIAAQNVMCDWNIHMYVHLDTVILSVLEVHSNRCVSDDTHARKLFRASLISNAERRNILNQLEKS